MLIISPHLISHLLSLVTEEQMLFVLAQRPSIKQVTHSFVQRLQNLSLTKQSLHEDVENN